MQLPSLSVMGTGPVPNNVNLDARQGPQLLIITFIFLPLALLMVALRTFTRLRLSNDFGADDVFLLAACIPTTGCAVVLVLAEQRWGWNRRVWDVPVDLLTLGLKLTIVSECLFCLACSLTRMSILLWTRKVMTIGAEWMTHVATIGMVVIALEAIIFCLVVICSCR